MGFRFRLKSSVHSSSQPASREFKERHRLALLSEGISATSPINFRKSAVRSAVASVLASAAISLAISFLPNAVLLYKNSQDSDYKRNMEQAETIEKKTWWAASRSPLVMYRLRLWNIHEMALCIEDYANVRVHRLSSATAEEAEQCALDAIKKNTPTAETRRCEFGTRPVSVD